MLAGASPRQDTVEEFLRKICKNEGETAAVKLLRSYLDAITPADVPSLLDAAADADKETHAKTRVLHALPRLLSTWPFRAHRCLWKYYLVFVSVSPKFEVPQRSASPTDPPPKSPRSTPSRSSPLSKSSSSLSSSSAPSFSSSLSSSSAPSFSSSSLSSSSLSSSSSSSLSSSSSSSLSSSSAPSLLSDQQTSSSSTRQSIPSTNNQPSKNASSGAFEASHFRADVVRCYFEASDSQTAPVSLARLVLSYIHATLGVQLKCFGKLDEDSQSTLQWFLLTVLLQFGTSPVSVPFWQTLLCLQAQLGGAANLVNFFTAMASSVPIPSQHFDRAFVEQTLRSVVAEEPRVLELLQLFQLMREVPPLATVIQRDAVFAARSQPALAAAGAALRRSDVDSFDKALHAFSEECRSELRSRHCLTCLSVPVVFARGSRRMSRQLIVGSQSYSLAVVCLQRILKMLTRAQCLFQWPAAQHRQLASRAYLPLLFDLVQHLCHEYQLQLRAELPVDVLKSAHSSSQLEVHMQVFRGLAYELHRLQTFVAQLAGQSELATVPLVCFLQLKIADTATLVVRTPSGQLLEVSADERLQQERALLRTALARQVQAFGVVDPHLLQLLAQSFAREGELKMAQCLLWSGVTSTLTALERAKQQPQAEHFQTTLVTIFKALLHLNLSQGTPDDILASFRLGQQIPILASDVGFVLCYARFLMLSGQPSLASSVFVNLLARLPHGQHTAVCAQWAQMTREARDHRGADPALKQRMATQRTAGQQRLAVVPPPAAGQQHQYAQPATTSHSDASTSSSSSSSSNHATQQRQLAPVPPEEHSDAPLEFNVDMLFEMSGHSSDLHASLFSAPFATGDHSLRAPPSLDELPLTTDGDLLASLGNFARSFSDFFPLGFHAPDELNPPPSFAGADPDSNPRSPKRRRSTRE